LLNKTEWLTPNRIIYQQYSGHITLDEMRLAHQTIAKMLSTASIGSDKIHLIIDIAQRESIAPEAMQLSTMRQLFS